MGNNDGGVEGVWTYPNGRQWGCQAKYFTTSSQFDTTQIDRSVRAALENYPELDRYTVCVATNLSAGPGRNARTRWADAAKNYLQWAYQTLGRHVTFELWDESTIVQLLVQDQEHAGRIAYWFNLPALDNAWFDLKFRQAAADADRRYTPKLNVDIPLSTVADGLLVMPTFVANCLEYSRALRNAFHLMLKPSFNQVHAGFYDVVAARYETMTNSINYVVDAIRHLEETSFAELSWPDIAARCSGIAADASAIRILLDNAKSSFMADGPLLGIVIVADELARFSRSDPARAMQQPKLLLIGPGGSGKTHFLFDVVQRSLRANRPALILLGEHFTDGNVLSQIVDQLGIAATYDVFLGALDAAAQAAGGRGLIVIDALNEGPGPTFWRSRLASVASEVARWPHLALAVSVRDVHEPDIVTQTAAQLFTRIDHPGFRFRELEAQETYFPAYEIVAPTTPLLRPEFENPLFLKLLCEGLQKRGLHAIPPNLRATTHVYDFYLESLNEHLARLRGDDPYDRLAVKAFGAFILASAQARDRLVTYDRAKEIIQSVDGHMRPFDRSMFRLLLSEGILTEVRRHDGSLAVRCSYERFADHFRAAQLISDAVGRAGRDAARQDVELIHALEEGTDVQQRSIREALAVEIPERLGAEIVELIEQPSAADVRLVLGSLQHRSAQSVTPLARRLVRSALLASELREELFDTIISAAVIPGHGIGIAFLLHVLQAMPMSRRDSIWSIFISRHWTDMSLGRLIRWTEGADIEAVPPDSIPGIAGVLAMSLTAMDPILRDRATKCLVRLIEVVPSVAGLLLTWFTRFNDPYVLERILAACYGAALRQPRAIGVVARSVYENVFRSQAVPLHLLARDYARLVVELALERGALEGSSVDLAVLRPPYGAAPPTPPPGGWYSLSERSSDHDGKSTRFRSLPFDLPGGKMENTPHHGSRDSPETRVGVTGIERWSRQRVRELGFFDLLASEGPDVYKKERINAKYTAIALQELLSRCADNFAVSGPQSSSRRYDTAAELGIRDIDPSLRLKGGRIMEDRSDRPWWAPDLSVRSTVDPHDPAALIAVTDPNGIRWYSFYLRVTNTGDADDRGRVSRLYGTYSVTAYFVRRHVLPMLPHILPEHVPRFEPEIMSDVFLYEFPDVVRRLWPAVLSTRVHHDVGTINLEATVTEYFRPTREDSAEYSDRSLISDVFVRLPTVASIEVFELTRLDDCRWADSRQSVAALDPQSWGAGPAAFLVRADVVEAAARVGEFVPVWMVLGKDDADVVGGAFQLEPSDTGGYRLVQI